MESGNTVMTTLELLQDKSPTDVLTAEVRAKVLVSSGHPGLSGTEITFPFCAVHWDSAECEDGGVAISKPGHSYCVVEVATMIFTGA